MSQKNKVKKNVAVLVRASISACRISRRVHMVVFGGKFLAAGI